MTALQALFEPSAVAILGASGRADNPFARPLAYLTELGFKGAVYPVNPGYTELHGLPCFPSLDDVPGPVDLVLMLVPAAAAVAAVPAAARAGATAAVVFASGFAEVGPAGVALQAELARAGREHGVRILGPNCQGIAHLPTGLAATFTAAVAGGFPESSSGVAYVGQSGAVGGSVLDLARERGLGLSSWASTGNQADLTTLDLAEELLERPEIRVLALYLESLPPGEQFVRVAVRAQALGKSIVVLRSGQSAAGKRAAASHTGAIIGDEPGLDALARRTGLVLVDDVDELLDAAHCLSAMPRPTGNRVAVVTTSGGAGSLAADHADRRGLVVPELDAAVQGRLAAVVPDFGAVANPVDVTAQLFNPKSEASFADVCTLVGADESVDAIVAVLTMVTGELAERVAEQLVDALRAATKPVVVVWLAGQAETAEARAVLRAAELPVFASVARAMDLVAKLRAPGRQVVRSVGLPAQVAAALTGRTTLTEAAGAAVLDAIGVPRPAGGLAHSADEADALADVLGGDVVLKVQSPSILHKTDVGGVRVGVPPADVPSTYAELAALAPSDLEGVLVQARLAPGQELIVGAVGSETGFPPVVTVGFGGVGAEVYADVVTRLAPVDHDEALDMIGSLRGARLLQGFRGRPAADVRAAADVVVRVSELAAGIGASLAEAEINPLIVHEEGGGAHAADFLLRLRPEDAR
jgi:acyl-CoA synthetase (NDP forming)